MEISIILLLVLLFYTYLGYGLVMYIIDKLTPKRKASAELPNTPFKKLTLVIAVYNEEEIIETKIKNCLELRYPEGMMDILFVTDGSTDKTNEIIARYSQVRYSFQPQRNGKIHAINRVMRTIKTPFVVFSDANVMLNKDAIIQLAKHFKEPQVAVVSGEKVVWSANRDKASASGEGIYWKYESALKRLDARVNTLVGSAGELFAMRTALYEAVPEDIVIEDFYLTLKLAMQGYKVAYEPKAVAMETASASIREEEKRKVRISAGGIQAIIKLAALFNIFKYGLLSFQFISHRVLRWTLAPAALPLVFILNLFLVGSSPVWNIILFAQILCYGLALVGYWLRESPTRIKLVYVPYYFVFMNLSVYKGWIRFIRKTQTVRWEKSARLQLDNLEIQRSLKS